jgi:hypothetical protein
VGTKLGDIMSVHAIKYYISGKCVSQFTGDDETLATVLFHLNFYSILPSDLKVTKRTSDNKEYLLKFIPGGYTWVEVEIGTLSVLYN